MLAGYRPPRIDRLGFQVGKFPTEVIRDNGGMLWDLQIVEGLPIGIQGRFA